MEQVAKPGLSASRLTMFFAIWGAVAGLISGVITSANILLNIHSLLLALLLFYVTYKLAAYPKIRDRFLMVPSGELKTGKKTNVVMTGFLPYFIMWLVFWVMVYTVLVVG